jgi:hypothetical protein
VVLCLIIIIANQRKKAAQAVVANMTHNNTKSNNTNNNTNTNVAKQYVLTKQQEDLVKQLQEYSKHTCTLSVKVTCRAGKQQSPSALQTTVEDWIICTVVGVVMVTIAANMIQSR